MQQDNNLNNKLIAKNTLIIYFRLFTTMLIGLYTSRVVLQVLGVSDLGLFSVVGGILAMFSIITSSLGAATTRFFNVEMGKPNGDVNKVFNINQMLHILLSLIFFLLAETIGLWYIYNKLVVSEGKFDDAMFIYQIAVLTACIGIVNSPYESLFSAHEKFGFLAWFDIINTTFRLILIILLQFYPGNSLRFYAIIMSLTTVNTFIVFHWCAIKRWPNIIRIRFVKGIRNYTEILTFSGWNLLSTISMIARNSGSDLLFNSFFGTSVNGAYAISKSVNNYIGSFSMNFDVSGGPQIIQSYSARNLDRCYYLVNKLGRFSILLFEMAFFPLYIELEFILQLWLGEVPEGVLTLCRMNLILCAFSVTCGGFTQLINASGKIKWFKIEISSFFLICVPIGYILFSMGFPPSSLLLLYIIADILQRMVQMFLLYKIIKFDSIRYIREAYLRPFIIAIIMIVFIYGYSLFHFDNNYIKIISILFCFLLTSYTIYTIGLTKSEQKKVIYNISNKISRMKRNS